MIQYEKYNVHCKVYRNKRIQTEYMLNAFVQIFQKGMRTSGAIEVWYY